MGKKMIAPKGTRDFLPGSMVIKNRIIKEIEKVYNKYGFNNWDGPAFEYFDTLTVKSGPDIEKEIYYFKDKAGRELALRFELTASISRMIASNPMIKKPVKAYSIGKVWRYEKPQLGRYREFFQADADIFGCSSIAAEVELLQMVRESLDKIGFCDWKIYLNNRKLLNAFVLESGILPEKKAEVFRAMDKIHKIGKEGVKREFLKCGLTEDDFEKLYYLINIEETDNLEMLSEIEKKLKSEEGIEGIKELRDILETWILLEGDDKRISVDFSMVRGLDYYTGPIYEVKIESGPGLGSIASGGRYDGLIEIYGGTPTPAAGISFGIERLIDLVEKDENLRNKFKSSFLDAFIVSYSKDLKKIFELAHKLRKNGVALDFDLLARAPKKQIQIAISKNVPFIIFAGDDEFETGKFNFKNTQTQEQQSMSIDEIISFFDARK